MKYLLDTNILVYAVDAHDPTRQARANEVLRGVGRSREATLSTQVLSEFASVALRRNLLPDPDAIVGQIQRLQRVFRILDVTPLVVLEAIRGVRDHRFSFYDAQIWAVARLNSIPVLLSEDFNPGASIEGVLFINPLDPSFDLATL